MEIVVAASPGPRLSLERERELIKAAILYGDHTTLISPASTMLLGAEQAQRFTIQEQIELFRRVAPDVSDSPDIDTVLSSVDALMHIVAMGRGTGPARLRRKELLDELQPILEGLTTTLRTIVQDAGFDEIAEARRAQLLTIESTNPGEALDLIASCIVAAKRAQQGIGSNGTHTAQMVEAFIARLSSHLSAGRGYLIFDEEIASLVDAAVREGVFEPAPGPEGRSAHAMAASAIVGRLPTFPDAGLDEIVDIRNELVSPLVRFRAAMVDVAGSMTSPPWETSFEDEVESAWIGTVRPALEEIQEAVRDNRALLKLSSDSVGAAQSSVPGIALVGAGLLGHAGVATGLGGVLATAAPLLKLLRDRAVSANEIRMRPFYFLHALDDTITKPHR